MTEATKDGEDEGSDKDGAPKTQSEIRSALQSIHSNVDSRPTGPLFHHSTEDETVILVASYRNKSLARKLAHILTENDISSSSKRRSGKLEVLVEKTDAKRAIEIWHGFNLEHPDVIVGRQRMIDVMLLFALLGALVGTMPAVYFYLLNPLIAATCFVIPIVLGLMLAAMLFRWQQIFESQNRFAISLNDFLFLIAFVALVIGTYRFVNYTVKIETERLDKPFEPVRWAESSEK